MLLNKKSIIVIIMLWSALMITGCGPRKFAVRPETKPQDFTVIEKSGSVAYSPITDARNDLDKKGEEPSSCGFSGSRGVTVMGDKNYKNPLLPEVDKHLKNAIHVSGLFTDFKEGESVDANYTFKGSLDAFHAVLNEQKAQDTQACAQAAGGWLLGALISSSVDVDASSDVQITGVLLKGNSEVWRQTVSKHASKIDSYSRTDQNLEQNMGEVIGEACKDLVTELAKFLSKK